MLTNKNIYNALRNGILIATIVILDLLGLPCQAETETSQIPADWTQTLGELNLWQKRLSAAEDDRLGQLRLERSISVPAKGTRISVDQSAVDWHLGTARAAVLSTSDKSWEAVNLCMSNLLTIGVRDEKPAMREIGRAILLEKELPSDCKRWIHIGAMVRALSPFITSDDQEDKQFAMSAESPSFWKDRLEGKHCDYYPSQAFPGKSSEEAFVLYMRWQVVKNFAGLDQIAAIEFTKSILARQNEDPDYLKLVQEEHDYAVEILAGRDPRIKMLENI